VGKLQSFYKKFIKCERDPESSSKIKINQNGKRGIILVKNPVDPLYKIPYLEKYRIRIIEKPYGQKQYNVWHFDINSLIQWLNTCKEWMNPLTNCLFLNATQDFVLNFLEINKVKRKLKISKNYNKKEAGYIKKKKMKVMSYVNTNMELFGKLVGYVKNMEEDNCYNFLQSNYNLIEKDLIDLNADINEVFNLDIIEEKIETMGLLHLAVLKGSKEIVNQLIYFGCNMDKRCGNNGYNVLHLCAIMNNIEIAKLLIQYGMPINDTCIFMDDICSVFEICDFLGNYEFVNCLITHQ